jgi:hypothetical protein
VWVWKRDGWDDYSVGEISCRIGTSTQEEEKQEITADAPGAISSFVTLVVARSVEYVRVSLVSSFVQKKKRREN